MSGALSKAAIRHFANEVLAGGGCSSPPSAQQLDDGTVVPLAASADYHLRMVIQEALKFARHARRSRLCPDDINKALRLLGAAPAYSGPSTRDPLQPGLIAAILKRCF